MRHFFLLLKRERPLEVWSLKALQLIGATPGLFNISSLKWRPNPISPNAAKEQFMFAAADGSLHFYIIEQNDLKVSFVMPPQSKIEKKTITALAWRAHFLISGDMDGNVEIFDLKNKSST